MIKQKLTITITKMISITRISLVYGPVLKITQRFAHAQNHVSVQRCRKSFTTSVLGDHDFPLTGSNFSNLTAFRAIFRHIFTVHAQKRLL